MAQFAMKTDACLATRHRAGTDRKNRSLVRARFLSGRVRDAELRPDERDRRIRRFSQPLPALALRHGVRALEQEPRVRPLEDLRDGHQQQPIVRVPARGQQPDRPEARHVPRLRPRRFFKNNFSFRSTDLDAAATSSIRCAGPKATAEPSVDRQDGEPRRCRAHASSTATASARWKSSSTPACRSRTWSIPWSPFVVRRRDEEVEDEPRGRSAPPPSQRLHGGVHQSRRSTSRSRRRRSRTSARGKGQHPVDREQDVLLFLMEMRRSSAGSERFSASCAKRPTTSRRRCRRR